MESASRVGDSISDFLDGFVDPYVISELKKEKERAA
jgi:hypothetical protein